MNNFSYPRQNIAVVLVHGVVEDTERTYVEVHPLRDLLSSESNLLDWSMLGMILTALTQPSEG